MKIATWNVNSIRSRLEIVTDWLKTNPIDVLCLQETKVVDADFPRAAIEDLGYHLYVSGQKSYNGVAILSRQPLEAVEIGFTPIVGEAGIEFDQQKRVIGGIVDGVRIVNLYVPNGSEVGSEKYDYKLRWLKVLQTYLQSFIDKGEQLCVCGDFNVALEDRDIYKPEGKEKRVMATPTEREALTQVLTVGLKDGFRKFTSDTGYYSWWDYRAAGFQRNRGWRIDHIYLTPQLYEQAIKCWIDVEPRKLTKPSDHTPVIVEV